MNGRTLEPPGRENQAIELVERLAHRPHADQLAVAVGRIGIGTDRRWPPAGRSGVNPICAGLAHPQRRPAECRGPRRSGRLRRTPPSPAARPRLRTLEATAATTLRSAAGSSMVIPPAMFT